MTPELKRAFAGSDAIEGTTPKFQVGGIYHIKGTCRRETLKDALLYLGSTAGPGAAAIVPVDGSALAVPLRAASTAFDITFQVPRPGILHLTIYDLANHNPHDNAATGIYLGDVVYPRGK